MVDESLPEIDLDEEDESADEEDSLVVTNDEVTDITEGGE